MNLKLPRLLTLMLLLAVFGTCEAATRHCSFNQGPSVEGNIFEPAHWPPKAGPEGYVRPGIVRPGYDHFYLYGAYRALAGLPLDSGVQKKIAPFDPCWSASKPGHSSPWGEIIADAIGEWVSQREAAGAPAVDTPKHSEYDWFWNAPHCLADAFKNAARTLAARQASYGRGPLLTNWISAQDAVFRNCSGDESYPADVPAGGPQWLVKDRAFQQAFALFYQDKHAEAATRFDAIAADSASPWSTIAPYLAARAEIRQANHIYPVGPTMAKAEKRLIPIAQAPEDTVLRGDARRLLQLVRLKLRPAELLAPLDAALTAPVVSDLIGQDLRDYYTAYAAADNEARAAAPFARWMSTMRGQGLDAHAASAEWRASGKLPWLVAALTIADGNTKGLALLLDDAAKIPPDSPAYTSARFHLARLAADGAAARREVRTMLKQDKYTLSIEDANAFRRIGLMRAAALDDIVAFAPRFPALPQDGVLPNVGSDGSAIFNDGLPLDMLVKVAQAGATPPALRSELRTVAWTRAFVFDRRDVATAMAPHIKQRIPGARNEVDAMLRLGDMRAYREAFALLLAQYPGMAGHVESTINSTYDAKEYARPNMHRSTGMEGERYNWWFRWNDFEDPAPAELEPEPDDQEGEIELVTAKPSPARSSFLTAQQARQLAAEKALFVQRGDPTDYLASLTMAHARLHPRDPRLPPVLSILIRTHGGRGSRSYTRDMFRHLHRYFPDSKWAKLTRSHK